MSASDIRMMGKESSFRKDSMNIDASNNPALWDEEYSGKGTIPSSRRVQPSHALVRAMNSVKMHAGTALDLGCGNGRNSIFLEKCGFKVKAVDFSNLALDLTKQKIKNDKKENNIEAVKFNVKRDLYKEFSNVDLILDSYCSCHIIDIEEKKDFLHNAYKSLVKGGVYIKIHLDSEDQYYINKKIYSDSYGFISLDESNNIMKRHYNLNIFNKMAGEFFYMKDCNKVYFNDVVQGESFERSVFFTILKKGDS